MLYVLVGHRMWFLRMSGIYGNSSYNPNRMPRPFYKHWGWLAHLTHAACTMQQNDVLKLPSDQLRRWELLLKLFLGLQNTNNSWTEPYKWVDTHKKRYWKPSIILPVGEHVLTCLALKAVWRLFLVADRNCELIISVRSCVTSCVVKCVTRLTVSRSSADIPASISRNSPWAAVRLAAFIWTSRNFFSHETIE